MSKTNEEKFISDLETVSHIIANWAAAQIMQGCTIDEVKRKIKQLMEVANRH